MRFLYLPVFIQKEDEVIAKVINESIMTTQVDESRRENNFHTTGRYERDSHILYYENETKEKIVKYIVSLLDVDENLLMMRYLNYKDISVNKLYMERYNTDTLGCRMLK